MNGLVSIFHGIFDILPSVTYRCVPVPPEPLPPHHNRHRRFAVSFKEVLFYWLQNYAELRYYTKIWGNVHAPEKKGRSFHYLICRRIWAIWQLWRALRGSVTRPLRKCTEWVNDTFFTRRAEPMRHNINKRKAFSPCNHVPILVRKENFHLCVRWSYQSLSCGYVFGMRFCSCGPDDSIPRVIIWHCCSNSYYGGKKGMARWDGDIDIVIICLNALSDTLIFFKYWLGGMSDIFSFTLRIKYGHRNFVPFYLWNGDTKIHCFCQATNLMSPSNHWPFVKVMFVLQFKFFSLYTTNLIMREKRSSVSYRNVFHATFWQFHRREKYP